MDESKKNDQPEEDIGEDQRRRMPLPGEWNDVMDELFEQAVRDGAFDNLPGKGKPLKFTRNPFNAEYELAYQLLRW